MNTLYLRVIRPLILPLAGAMVLAGCSSPKSLSKNLDKMKIKSETEAIEVHGDSLRIKVSGKIPPKSFHKKAIVKFAPILRYGDELTEEQELKPLYLQGEKVKKNKMTEGDANAQVKVIKFQKGGSFSYIQNVPFTPALKKSKMGMDYQVKIASSYDDLDQCVTGKRDSAIRGTITTSLLVKPLDDVLYYSASLNDESGANGNGNPGGNNRPGGNGGDMGPNIKRNNKNIPDVVFYYVVDVPTLEDSVNNGPAARKLNSILSEIASKRKSKDSKVKVNGVTFRSFASPDGEFRRNAALTQGRAKSGKDYVSKQMKSMGIKEVYDKDMVRVPDPASEDWSGFEKLVRKSNFSGKDEIIGIIKSKMPLEEKEKAFRASSSWLILKNDILPRLRRTEVYFNAVGIEALTDGGSEMATSTGPDESSVRPLEEIKSAYSQNDPNLNQKELLILAASMEDLNEKEKIYKMYVDKYPADYRGKVNLATVMLKNGSQPVVDYRVAMNSNARIDEAAALLEQLSTQYPNNDTIKNNLGVAKRLKRDYVAAADLYAMAKSKGINTSTNNAILSIKTGNYADAVASFRPDQCDYNVALALTLNKEFDKALDKIKCITDAGKANADVYYLKAIIYARQQNKTDMATAISRCLQEAKKLNKLADYKTEISKDVEFGKYFESPEFKTALSN